jgi:hypothetical protein
MNKIMTVQFLVTFAISLYLTMVIFVKMIQIHAYILKDRRFVLPPNWLLAFTSLCWACTVFAFLMMK